MYKIIENKINDKIRLYYIVEPKGYPKIPGAAGNLKDAETICNNLNKEYFADQFNSRRNKENENKSK